jgi:parallel beta-helix repeat protein
LRLRQNQTNAVFVAGGSTTRDITLDSTGIVEGILSLGNHYIGAETTLTVQPGSAISFRSGGWLSTWPGNPSSTLVAEGTGGRPIRFTSAAANPQAGDWAYLYVYPTGAARLRHCVVEYAAQGVNTQARLLVDSCTFHHNTTGVVVSNSAGGTIVNSQFSGNGTAVTNQSPARPVRAFGNWWNHPTGPTHAANPGGQGEPVSNGVLYQGWLRSPGPDAGGRVPTPLVLGQTIERTLSLTPTKR